MHHIPVSDFPNEKPSTLETDMNYNYLLRVARV